MHELQEPELFLQKNLQQMPAEQVASWQDDHERAAAATGSRRRLSLPA